jgi:ankyrin repeat protein
MACVSVLVWSTFSAIYQQKLNLSLIVAITKQDEAGVLSLLDAGADANARRNMQEVNNLADLVRVLFRRDTNKEPESTALMLASAQSNTRIVSALLDHRADVNAHAHRLTPLMVSVDNQTVKIANVLINRGANVEWTGELGRTALLKSATRQDPRMMQLLLEKGANVNAKDQDGRTPLFLAVSYGFVPHVKLLLNHGADAAQTETYGRTPLKACIQIAHIYSTLGQKADRMRYESIITLLKAAGAKTDR